MSELIDEAREHLIPSRTRSGIGIVAGISNRVIDNLVFRTVLVRQGLPSPSIARLL
jgi:hypothetical protein